MLAEEKLRAASPVVSGRGLRRAAVKVRGYGCVRRGKDFPGGDLRQGAHCEGGLGAFSEVGGRARGRGFRARAGHGVGGLLRCARRPRTTGSVLSHGAVERTRSCRLGPRLGNSNEVGSVVCRRVAERSGLGAAVCRRGRGGLVKEHRRRGGGHDCKPRSAMGRCRSGVVEGVMARARVFVVPDISAGRDAPP